MKLDKNNIPVIKKVVIFFILWRLLTVFFALLANNFLLYAPTFPYSAELAKSGLPSFIYSWANFDGVHYITIAEQGYIGTGLIQAFFPIFPILMRGLMLLGFKPIVAGMLISNLSMIGVLYFGFKLTKKWFSEAVANQFLLILLLFPTSFYLGAVYNESLFLLLILAGAWYYETKKNAFSGLLMGLSSGVRLVGLMWLPAFFSGWMRDLFKNKLSKEKIKEQLINSFKKNRGFVFGLTIGLLAFISYAIFLWMEFDDPLYFFSVQSQFGAGRQTSLILLPQTLYRSLMIILTARPIDLKYFTYVQDLVLSLLMLAGIVLAWNKFKLQYMIFALLAFLLPTFTGNLSSMPRYVIVLFPVMMWWATVMADRPRLRIVYYLLSAILLALNTVLFIQGYWVA